MTTQCNDRRAYTPAERKALRTSIEHAQAAGPDITAAAAKVFAAHQHKLDVQTSPLRRWFSIFTLNDPKDVK